MKNQKEGKEEKKREPILVGWNINCDRRVDHAALKAALPECRIEQRLPRILKHVEDKYLARSHYAYVALFEMDKATLAKVQVWCDARGFYHVNAAYNTTPASFHIFVFTNDPRGFSEEVKVYPLTLSGKHVDAAVTDRKSPKNKAECLGEEFEKILFCVQIPDGGPLLCVTHLALGNEGKKNQIKMIADILKKRKDEGKVVLLGDFNCFDRDKQEPCMLEGVFDPLNDVLSHLTKDEKSTFSVEHFPYDHVFHMTPADKQQYDTFMKNEHPAEEFRVWLCMLGTRYDCQGIALDHVFASSSSAVQVSYDRCYDLSDHAIMKVAFLKE